MNKKNILTLLALASVLFVTSCSEDKKDDTAKTDGQTGQGTQNAGGGQGAGTDADADAKAKAAGTYKSYTADYILANFKGGYGFSFEELHNIVAGQDAFKDSIKGDKDKLSKLNAAFTAMEKAKAIITSYTEMNNGSGNAKTTGMAKIGGTSAELLSIYEAQSGIGNWSGDIRMDGTNGTPTFYNVEKNFYDALYKAVLNDPALGIPKLAADDLQSYYYEENIKPLIKTDVTQAKAFLNNTAKVNEFAQVLKRMAECKVYVSDVTEPNRTTNSKTAKAFADDGKLMWKVNEPKDDEGFKVKLSMYLEAAAIINLLIDGKFVGCTDIASLTTKFGEYTIDSSLKPLEVKTTSAKASAEEKMLMTRLFNLLDLLPIARPVVADAANINGQAIETKTLYCLAYYTPLMQMKDNGNQIAAVQGNIALDENMFKSGTALTDNLKNYIASRKFDLEEGAKAASFKLKDGTAIGGAGA